jgi:hypothetical protein
MRAHQNPKPNKIYSVLLNMEINFRNLHTPELAITTEERRLFYKRRIDLINAHK